MDACKPRALSISALGILDLPKTILNETVLIFFFFYLNETHEKYRPKVDHDGRFAFVNFVDSKILFVEELYRKI